jgi:hypothetical protein
MLLSRASVPVATNFASLTGGTPHVIRSGKVEASCFRDAELIVGVDASKHRPPATSLGCEGGHGEIAGATAPEGQDLFT